MYMRRYPMRRKDKEIKEKELLNEILNKALVLRLGMCLENKPYVVPMNFVYYKDNIYVHCAKKGQRLDILKENNNVCFQMDIKSKFVEDEKPCECGMDYLSIIGEGKAYIVNEIIEKKEILQSIVKKYTGKDAAQFPEEVVKNTTAIRIDIEKITGKKSGY